MTKDYAIMILKDAQAKLLEVSNTSLYFDGVPQMADQWRRGRASGQVDSAYWSICAAINFMEMAPLPGSGDK